MRFTEPYLYDSSTNYDKTYKTVSKIPLMTATKLGSKNNYAVWTRHRGERVYTVRRINISHEKNSRDRSQTAFIILRHILELNQSKAFLKAPDNQFVIR